MAQRIKGQEITRRTVIADRTSEAPALRVLADLDSSRGHFAIGSTAVSVFGKLADASARRGHAKAIQKDADDTTQGARDRTAESLAGTPAQQQEALVAQSDGYRRGYYLTEATNKLYAAKMDIAREAAKLEPGEDINPLLRDRFGALLQDTAFQDPQVMRRLQPQIAQAQQEIASERQKTELAEVFERQSENLAEMVRNTIKAGGLRTPEQIASFRAALDTEEFAYVSKDEADDIISAGYANLFETGAVSPDEAAAFLQTKQPGDDAPLWDRKGWTEKFETAIAAGAAVRQKAVEEHQANQLSGMEYELQERAGRGALGISEINALADRVGLTGTDRLTFTRRWIDQNQAGLRHAQSEARRAAEHRETVQAITAGNALSMTDAQLAKSAEKEWADAVVSKDKPTQDAVLARYTRAGIVIPQLKDLLGRTTESTLAQNAALYTAIAKVDRITADRYLSEANATLFAQHFENTQVFGMTPQESIASLPTGATKGRREDVARETSASAVQYFKDNPEMPNGGTRPLAVRRMVEQTAIRLGLANPNASVETNLQAAERRVASSLITINGRTVPRGGARQAAVPGIEAFISEVADSFVKDNGFPAEVAAGIYAAPFPDNPNRFALMLPTGYPVYNPKSGKPITFDPMQLAWDQHMYTTRKEAQRVRAAQAKRQEGRTTGAGGVRNLPATEGPGKLAPDAAQPWAAYDPNKPLFDKSAEPIPDSFLEFLQSARTKRKAAGL